jgi:hypothetical protein
MSSGTTLAVGVGATGDWTASDITTLPANFTFPVNSTFGIDTTDGDFTCGITISGGFNLIKLGANALTLTERTRSSAARRSTKGC